MKDVLAKNMMTFKKLIHMVNISVRRFFSRRRNTVVFSLVLMMSLIVAIVFIVGRQGKAPIIRESVGQTVNVRNETREGAEVALQNDILQWQKQVKLTPSDTDADTTVIERIPSNQEYRKGTMKAPPGWKVQWSGANPATNPTTDEQFNWQDDENAVETVTYIRLMTETVTTVKPTAQSAMNQPLEQEEVAIPTGAKTLAAKNFGDRMFTIYQAVDVENGLKDNGSGTGDSSDLTIGCIDLRTRFTCTAEGVSFPTYMSSAAGTSLGAAGTPKDISTPLSMEFGFDDENGRMYIPAQKGNTYGVNCIDLLNMKNCGYTSYTPANSAAAPNQAVGANPVVISGFAEKDNKLYGTAAFIDNDPATASPLANLTDDFTQMICFDMTDQQPCDDYGTNTFSTIPSYRYNLNEHQNTYYDPSQHLMVGSRYYWIVNYIQKSSNWAIDYYTQIQFENRLMCYDVATKSLCSSWPNALSATYQQIIFQPARNINVPGKSISTDLLEKPSQLFPWKGTDGSIKAVCVGFGDSGLGAADPAVRCYDQTTGAPYNEQRQVTSPTTGEVGTATYYAPRFMMPSRWLNTPWEPAFAITEIQENNQDRILLSFHLSTESVFGGGRRAAVLCYDWKTESPCEGYRHPNYWYEINEGDSMDSSYVVDGKCVIGVSGYDFLWSFDSATGETPCRHTINKVKIKPQVELQRAFCDGKQRTPKWGYLRLNRASLYNFQEVRVTVKDKQGQVIPGLENVNLKDIQSGKLDLSNVVYAAGTNDELQVEINSKVLNTSSWADDPSTPDVVDKNYPLVSVVMNTNADNTEGAQYCYETQVKPQCDIASVATASDITSTTVNDILKQANSTSLTVNQPADVQCFKDLKISVAPDKTRVGKDEPISYTVRVDNKANDDPDGRGDANGAIIEVTIPNGTTVASSGGGSVEGNKIRWTNINIEATKSVSRTFTLRAPSAVVSQAPAEKGKVYAATVEQPLTLQSQVIYGDDVYQTDNSSSNNSVVFAVDVPEPTPDPEPEPTPDPEPEPTPTPTPTPKPVTIPTNPVNPRTGEALPEGVTVMDGRLVKQLPKSLKSFLPATLERPVESVLNAAYNFVAPVPDGVAAALPYGTIAVLLALAFVYIYQAAQEARLRRQLIELRKRVKRTEQMRKNYIDLTSHYLTTPITTMQSTVELLRSMKKLPVATADTAKSRLDGLVKHTQLLLTASQEAPAHDDKAVVTLAKAKVRSFLLTPGFIVPVVGVLALAVLSNAMFVWGDKYNNNAVNIAVQSSFYVLGAVALGFAYYSLHRQRQITKAAKQELKIEQDITTSQTNLINNTGAILLGDIVRIDQLAPSIVNLPHGEAFSNGLHSLKAMVAKMTYLSALKTRTKVPSISYAIINDIVNKELHGLQTRIEEKNLKVATSIANDASIKTDKAGLVQLLSSTLDNAVKFSKNDGQVELSIVRNKGKMTTIVIKDNGEGIPKEKLSQLFQPFTRATDTEKFDYEGVGLDLYMDKLIVEQFGGTIDITSREKSGTTVTIKIPS